MLRAGDTGDGAQGRPGWIDFGPRLWPVSGLACSAAERAL